MTGDTTALKFVLVRHGEAANTKARSLGGRLPVNRPAAPPESMHRIYMSVASPCTGALDVAGRPLLLTVNDVTHLKPGLLTKYDVTTVVA